MVCSPYLPVRYRHRHHHRDLNQATQNLTLNPLNPSQIQVDMVAQEANHPYVLVNPKIATRTSGSQSAPLNTYL